MKKAVCLQHVPFEGPGVFASALEACGYSLRCHLVPQEGLPTDAGDFLLVMGGPMSVNDQDEWIRAETDFIRHAVEQGTPYLGICLGSQFLAKACGGCVQPGEVMEIGMTSIELTEEGRQDPVLSVLPSNPSVMEWHGEGIQAPEKASTLARSENFDVQAFRIGTQAYGLLFHLELDAAGLAKLCEACESDLLRAKADSDAVQSTALANMATMQQMAREIITRLCSIN